MITVTHLSFGGQGPLERQVIRLGQYSETLDHAASHLVLLLFFIPIPYLPLSGENRTAFRKRTFIAKKHYWLKIPKEALKTHNRVHFLKTEAYDYKNLEFKVRKCFRNFF